MSRHRLVSFAGILVIYAALLWLSRALLTASGSSPAVDALIALLPLPAALAILAIAWSDFESLDELQRQIRLMALAVSFGGTLLIMLSWGFLEGVGAGRPSGFAVFGILIALYLGGLVWARARYG